MNDRRRNRGRDRPQRDREWLHDDVVLFQEALDEQDRTHGEENVFAEERADIVHRRGEGADGVALLFAERAVFLRRSFGHRCEQGTHHLCMAADRGCQPDGRHRLPEQHIYKKQPSHRGPAQPADQDARAFLQPLALQKADDRQHQEHDADVTVLVEGMAEQRERVDEVESRGPSGGEHGGGDDQERVYPDKKSDNYHRYPQQRDHLSPFAAAARRRRHIAACAQRCNSRRPPQAMICARRQSGCFVCFRVGFAAMLSCCCSAKRRR